MGVAFRELPGGRSQLRLPQSRDRGLQGSTHCGYCVHGSHLLPIDHDHDHRNASTPATRCAMGVMLMLNGLRQDHTLAMRPRLIGSAVIATLTAVLLGWTAPAPPAGELSPNPTGQQSTTAAPGELVGRGLVRQEGDALPQFCMGIATSSYPPLCAGPPIRGWDWSIADGEENAATVTWGDYVVHGTWDGSSFTVTRPPRNIASNESWGEPDPRQDPRNPGTGTKARLQQIQREIWETERPPADTRVENGYLFRYVPYDDGSLQAAMDKRFGPGIVVVRSLLRPAH